MLKIKRIVRYFGIGIFRMIYSRWYSFVWLLRKGSVVRKPKHVNYGNMVDIGCSSIDSGCRLDCYPTEKCPRPTIIIGNKTMISFNFTALSAGKLTIGDNCLFASDVFISTEDHGMIPGGEKYIEQPLTSKDVTIENNCWIGEKVCILAGVHVGQWSIIGSGAVVTHDVPEYSIAVGNPARVIKRFNFQSWAWEKVTGEDE